MNSPSAQSLHERGTFRSAHQGARVGILVSWGGKVGDVVVGWDTRIDFSNPMLDSLLSGLVGIA